MATDPEDAFGRVLDTAVLLARSGEKLLAACATLLPVSQALSDLSEFDPDLKPEVDAAADLIKEAFEVLRRASDFQDARYEATLVRIQAELNPPTEGESHE